MIFYLTLNLINRYEYIKYFQEFGKSKIIKSLKFSFKINKNKIYFYFILKRITFYLFDKKICKLRVNNNLNNNNIVIDILLLFNCNLISIKEVTIKIIINYLNLCTIYYIKWIKVVKIKKN